MAEEREIEAGEGGGEGFLARWSRRKRAAREGLAVAPEPPATPPAEAPAETAPPHATEEDPVDLESLPRIEEITAETDISIFFRKGVPAALRNAALRRAWSLDPTIRDFIGPADYAWDWNTPGGAPDFLDGVGETPAIRALVERMFSPPAPEPAEREGDRPRAVAAADERPPVPDPVRLSSDGTPAVAPAEPPPAGGTEGGAAPDSLRSDGSDGPKPPPPRRHGGALPG